jgi:hypothetical protein
VINLLAQKVSKLIMAVKIVVLNFILSLPVTYTLVEYLRVRLGGTLRVEKSKVRYAALKLPFR